jgi:hypothetical protein
MAARTQTPVPLKPLWKFGVAGWSAVAVGGGLLAAHFSGYRPFDLLMTATQDMMGGWFEQYLWVVAIYAGLGVFGEWILMGSPEIEPNLWIAATYAIAFTIAGVSRRWLWIGLTTSVGVCFMAMPFASASLMRWMHTVGSSLHGFEYVFYGWQTVGMLVQVLLVLAATGNRRLAGRLSVLLVVGLAFRASVIDLNSLRTGPLVFRASAHWLWYLCWFGVLLHWAVGVRRVRLRPPGMVCEKCSYDLAGIATKVCPECGTLPA